MQDELQRGARADSAGLLVRGAALPFIELSLPFIELSLPFIELLTAFH